MEENMIEVDWIKGKMYEADVRPHDDLGTYVMGVEYNVVIQPMMDRKYKEYDGSEFFAEDNRIMMYNNSGAGDSRYIVLESKEDLLKKFEIAEMREM